MKRHVTQSVYYDDNDNLYDMVECFYDNFFVYVIDYEHLSKGHFDLKEIYRNIEKDVSEHTIPCAPGYGDNMWLVDYAYYLDFHPDKSNFTN